MTLDGLRQMNAWLDRLLHVPLPTDPEALAMAAGSMVAAMDELRRRSIAAAEDLEALA